MADGARDRPAPRTADLTATPSPLGPGPLGPGPLAPSPLAAVRLYLIATLPGAELDAERLERLRAAAAGGVDAVQLRMKRADTGQRRAALRAARAALPPHVRLLINDDLDALFDARGAPLADGVHLGRDDAAALAPESASPACDAAHAPDRAAADGAATTDTPPPSDTARRAAGLRAARARLGPALALGSSTREPWEVALARDAGADHLGFGAVAVSTSKADTAPASLDDLQRLTAAHPELPLFPIGGLTPDTLAQLARRGVRRAAVGAAILDARDPESAARACRAALGVD